MITEQKSILEKVLIKPSKSKINSKFVDIHEAQAKLAQAQCIPGHCNGQCQGG